MGKNEYLGKCGERKSPFRNHLLKMRVVPYCDENAAECILFKVIFTGRLSKKREKAEEHILERPKQMFQ